MNKIIVKSMNFVVYTFLLIGCCFSKNVLAVDAKNNTYDLSSSNVNKTFILNNKFTFVHLGQPMSGMPYQLIMADGTVIEGASDQKGNIVSLSGNKAETITLNVLKDDMRASGEKGDKKRFFVILDEKGDPIPNARYKITMANGFEIEGVADEDGETVSVYTDKPELLTIKKLKSNVKSIHTDENKEHNTDVSCELNTLGPLLNKTKYRDYKLGARSNKSYTEEKITLADNVKLTVETGACIESSTTIFSFIVPREILNKKSSKEKLIWLRTQLDALEWKKDSSPPLEKIDLIIKRIDKMKHSIDGKFRRVEICRNGIIPGDKNDCSWDSGGGTKYEWRENDVYIYLILTDVRSA